jgi:hypothetical protein
LIETSKTDIYRQDHTVVIARTNNDTCPIAMCETYLLKADIALDSDDFIFRSLSFKCQFYWFLSKSQDEN